MSDHEHDDHVVEQGDGHDCCDHDGCAHDHGHAELDMHDHSHGHAPVQPPFDAEAFGGVDISGDGGLLKKVLVEGDPSKGTPSPGSKVKVHYVGTLLDGSKFDSSRDRPGFFEFDVGVGRVIKGWDEGIVTMAKGEKCVLACRADYAYGEQGSPPKIPGGATLLFEVELFSWKEKKKEKFEMSAEERIAEAEALKARGTADFKGGDYAEAMEEYEEASGFIGIDLEAPAGQEEAVTALYMSCLTNAAQCALKLQEYVKAVHLCDEALMKEPNSVKALFRRGSARMRMGEWGEAKADLRQASSVDPKNKEVRDLFAEVSKKEADAKKSEKAMYGKMFG